MKPSRESTWAPRGETPVLEFACNWKKLSAIGRVSFRQIYFQLHDGSVKAPEIIVFLKHLDRHIQSDLFVVWDGLRRHWSRAVREHVESLDGWIVLEQLPSRPNSIRWSISGHRSSNMKWPRISANSPQWRARPSARSGARLAMSERFGFNPNCLSIDSEPVLECSVKDSGTDAAGFSRQDSHAGS